MKIAVADNNGMKFTKDIIDHWIKKGHEVRYERGASEFLSQWADLYYVDTWDNNIHYLYKLYHGLHNEMPPEWDNKKKPIVVCRALDWEVWIGFVRDQSIVDWVDKVICIAPHIQKKLESEMEWHGKLKLIKPGVNLDRFPLKTRETDGYQIGMALGDMWWPKNHMAGLDIFTTLLTKNNKWRLHIRGQHEGGNEFWKQMYEHYLDSRNIRDKVTLYSHVDDMNDWYENIDYLLHPGMKEAFCYAIGEAMAKGIKPIINNFYGAPDIWNFNYLYNTHHQAVVQFSNGTRIRPNKVYRQYIEENYNVKRMMQEYDSFLGL